MTISLPGGVRVPVPRRCALLLIPLILAGCAQRPGAGSEDAGSATPRTFKTFSGQLPGAGLPAGWSPLEFGSFKKATLYELVLHDGRTVLQANAAASASGLMQRVDFDPRQYPLLSWSWKVPALIETADNTVGHLEDSPVRVIVAFQGDTRRLSMFEQVTFRQFELITHRKLPYATLMYIWENRAAKGTVIASAHTDRIKMIVAESGSSKLGMWDLVTRNIYDDYVLAFGEEPPAVKWIGVMTDTDNTGLNTRAYYGDITLGRAAAPR